MANPHHHRHIGFPGGREQKRRRTKTRRHTTSTGSWREGLREGRKSGHSFGQGTESAELHKSRGRVRRRAVVAKRRCGTDRRRWTSSRSFWRRTRQTRGWLREVVLGAAVGARCAGDVGNMVRAAGGQYLASWGVMSAQNASVAGPQITAQAFQIVRRGQSEPRKPVLENLPVPMIPRAFTENPKCWWCSHRNLIRHAYGTCT